MSRALLTLRTIADRDRACRWVRQAPIGSRVEFKSPRRTLPQNDRFYWMLTQIASQVTHCGRKYDTGTWKALLMHAWGREVRFIPSLDEAGVIPIAYSSSDLSKEEMTDLLTFMESWGEQNGVVFGDHESRDRETFEVQPA